MADISVIVPLILRYEGGYVNDKDDSGGATNRGVTLATYRQYKHKKGEPEPGIKELKKMSHEEWLDILRLYYWDKCKGDDIYNQSVANMLVDFAWHSGVRVAVKEVQPIAGTKADGIFGVRTLEAVNGCDPVQLFAALKRARIEYLHRICELRPENEKFKNGWMNRVNSIVYDV